MRNALAPTRCMYAISLCWSVLFLMILTPYVMYIFCKRILFTVGVFLIGCNIVSKQLTTGDSFKRDDCVAFQMLRMVSKDRKGNSVGKVVQDVGFTYSYSRVLLHVVCLYSYLRVLGSSMSIVFRKCLCYSMLYYGCGLYIHNCVMLVGFHLAWE